MSLPDESTAASAMSIGDIERVYRELGLTEPQTASYFAGLRAMTSAAETPPEFVLSYNSFPIETK